MDLKSIIKVPQIEKFEFITWEHALSKIHALQSLKLEDIGIATFFGGGVYRMYDNSGEIIYVGKSNNIHRRLLQHVGKRSNTSYFIEEVVKIEYHVNNDPVFQTLLEGIFIAYHAPKYNDEVKERNIGGK